MADEQPEPDPPSLRTVFDAIAPPGTDTDALLAALKGAHRTGGHVPGRATPDISGPPADGLALMRMLRAQSAAGPPPDPFGPGAAPSMALGEMYADLVAHSGIPLASVERILGAMLAVAGMMQDEGGKAPG